MKLSVVIICWNDLRVLGDCLHSIYAGTHATEFEVLVSDNGSTDGSIEFVRTNYPQVRILENNANLGFAKGNNVGIRASTGEYVLILNPDTILSAGALDNFVAFAERHQEAGAFGCRVLNPDGSYQISGRPFPTIWRYWIAGLYLRFLGGLSKAFDADVYTGWHGNSEKAIDWQSGCCVLFRGDLLRRLGGFDEQFFYHFEEVDLCFRVHKAGFPILFTPEAVITHLGGQSVGRFPIRFAVERLRNRYRYFYKHYGLQGCRNCRRATIAWFAVRRFGYSVLNVIRPSDAYRSRLAMYDTVIRWNRLIDPVRFVEYGEEPGLNLMDGSTSSVSA
jgi:GT2 family glycosyltransferase